MVSLGMDSRLLVMLG